MMQTSTEGTFVEAKGRGRAPSRSFAVVLLALAVALAVLALGGCSSDDPTATTAPTATRPAPTPTTPPANLAPTPTLAPEYVASGIVPVPDFYERFWPDIEIRMADLYQQALNTAGGELQVWGFQDVPDLERNLFLERFPGLTVTGLAGGFQTGAAMVQTAQSGQFLGDVFNGGASWREPYDEDLFDTEFDWTQYGLPEVFNVPGLPGMLNTGSTEYQMWYNTDQISADELPTDPHDFLDPKWKGKLVTAPGFFGGGFSIMSYQFGMEDTRELAIALLEEADMLITSVPEQLVISGERPIFFPSARNMDFRSGAPILPRGYKGSGIIPNYAGIMEGARNVPGAVLWILWRYYDPDLLLAPYSTIPELSTAVPNLALPSRFLDPNPQATEALKNLVSGDAIWLGPERITERGQRAREFAALASGQ